MHRGFLYQHLVVVASLLTAMGAGASSVSVERDEDVEIEFPNHRLYAQVKTRSSPLAHGDVRDVLLRFDAIRREHESGARPGSASFAIVSSIVPGPDLHMRLKGDIWPADVSLHWPGGPSPPAPLPPARGGIVEALAVCHRLAGLLPFAMLSPDALVWKLAGHVLTASAGLAPYADHRFTAAALPQLFEQLAIQLQEFPTPPAPYRSLDDEPFASTNERVRLISGFSGAGKTSWASHVALHSADLWVYIDVSETPGSALAATVSRELAARLSGRSGGGLGEMLLPGANGLDVLRGISRRLIRDGIAVTLVLDNAHLVPPPDLRALVTASESLKFVLLAQPTRTLAVIEATLGVSAEALRGWTNESAAREGASIGCHGDFAAYERLLGLTAGLPLYVQSALRVAFDHHQGGVALFCESIEKRTHVVETAQELILERVFEDFTDEEKRAIAALSICDVPIEQSEAATILAATFAIETAAVPQLMRRLRRTGAMQYIGIVRFKVHDAMRLLGQAHLERLGPSMMQAARQALRDLLVESLPRSWDMQRVFLLLRTFVALKEVEPLVSMATDELFHEFGYMAQITDFLEQAAASDATPPKDRFWALDGLILARFKSGDESGLIEMVGSMRDLVAEHSLGSKERLAFGMKAMVVAARRRDARAVAQAMAEIEDLLPDEPDFVRIARYNYAHAQFELGRFGDTSAITAELIDEYYRHLEIAPSDVIGKNAPELRRLIRQTDSFSDDAKHLADTLDLHAKSQRRLGRPSGLALIHAMKFYDLARAADSLIRAGQDLVDEFVGRNDYIGARDVLERTLLPNVLHLKLASRITQVRSQYAVVLAYCGDFRAAKAEIKRLEPYETGLDEQGRAELRMQRALIGRLELTAPPPQWQFTLPPGKYAVNAPCPCGSGRKFKKCHGDNRARTR